MANEGIMALPQGAAMQEDQGQMPMVTSADSYDAAKTALGMANPQDLSVLTESLRQNMAELELTPSQLETLIEIFEYVSQNPGQYKTIRQDLINRDFVDADDLPEEYDAEFLGAILIVLNELKATAAQGANAAMMEGPPVEGMGMQPMAMAEGGLADMAALLAAQGRNGDKMLAHITPEEAEFLKQRGGSGTINPATGLPEFFLKKVFNAVKSVVKSVTNVVKKVLKSPVGRILGTIALATVLGPTAIGMTLGSAGTAALASGAVTLAGGGSFKDALISGAMGYIGGGGTIMGTNPLAAVGKYMPGLAGSALNTGFSTGVIAAGIGKLGGMSTQDALRMGLTSGATAGAMQGARNSGLIAEGRVTKEDILKAEGGSGTPATGTDRFGSPSAIGEAGPTGPVGSVGTAQDMLAAKAANYSPTDYSFDSPFVNRSAPGLRPTGSFLDANVGISDAPADYSVAPARATSGIGLRGPAFRLSPSEFDFSSAAGGTGASTNYGLMPRATGAAAAPGAAGPGAAAPGAAGPNAFSPLQLPPGAPPEPGMTVAGSEPGFLDRMTTGAKDLYNEYLSPSRPGLPADAGILRKYGPVALAGTAAVAAAGGMKSEPVNQNPAFNRNYTGMDYIRDNPQMFQGGLDFSYQRPTTPNPVVVPTPSYASIPVGQPGVVQPGGLTQQPGGVAQPYNVAGLYGVPLIYGQPPGYAKGGELRPTEFPRKNGPINGPGTGTSDSIPAMLSDGEFVFTAKAVRNAGGGSRRKGAARMYKLMKKLEGGPVKAK